MCNKNRIPPEQVIKDIVDICRGAGLCAEMAAHVSVSVILTIGVNAEKDCAENEKDKLAVVKMKKRIVHALHNASMMMSADSIDRAHLAIMQAQPLEASKTVM